MIPKAEGQEALTRQTSFVQLLSQRKRSAKSSSAYGLLCTHHKPQLEGACIWFWCWGMNSGSSLVLGRIPEKDHIPNPSMCQSDIGSHCMAHANCELALWSRQALNFCPCCLHLPHVADFTGMHCHPQNSQIKAWREVCRVEAGHSSATALGTC